MSDTQLEQRIRPLEQQMWDVLQKVHASSSHSSAARNWHKSLDMFVDHPVMKQIDEAGMLIRRQDREQGAA